MNRIDLEQRSLVTQLADDLREAMLGGRLSMGQRLDEAQLSHDYGVSRATVREALRALLAAGLLEKQPRKPWRVRQISEEKIHEVMMVRAVLEALAASLVAQSLTPGVRARLTEALNELQQVAQTDDLSEFNRKDLRLHQTILELSRNEILIEAWMPLQAYTVLFIGAQNEKFPSAEELLASHQRAVDAILRGDPLIAASTMRNELLHSYSRFSLFPDQFNAPWNQAETDR